MHTQKHKHQLPLHDPHHEDDSSLWKCLLRARPPTVSIEPSVLRYWVSVVQKIVRSSGIYFNDDEANSTDSNENLYND